MKKLLLLLALLFPVESFAADWSTTNDTEVFAVVKVAYIAKGGDPNVSITNAPWTMERDGNGPIRVTSTGDEANFPSKEEVESVDVAAVVAEEQSKRDASKADYKPGVNLDMLF